MHYQQTVKNVIGVAPQARLNNGSFTVTSVDRSGFDSMSAVFVLGVTDVGLTAMKLQESDDNAIWSDITGADYSISSTLPAAGNSNTVWRWDVSLTGRKRYIRAVITVGNGTLGAFGSLAYELSRAHNMPYNASTAGLQGLLTL